jgi:hypothetical protein
MAPGATPGASTKTIRISLQTETPYRFSDTRCRFVSVLAQFSCPFPRVRLAPPLAVIARISACQTDTDATFSHLGAIVPSPPTRQNGLELSLGSRKTP